MKKRDKDNLFKNMEDTPPTSPEDITPDAQPIPPLEPSEIPEVEPEVPTKVEPEITVDKEPELTPESPILLPSETAYEPEKLFEDEKKEEEDSGLYPVSELEYDVHEPTPVEEQPEPAETLLEEAEAVPFEEIKTEMYGAPVEEAKVETPPPAEKKKGGFFSFFLHPRTTFALFVRDLLLVILFAGAGFLASVILMNQQVQLIQQKVTSLQADLDKTGTELKKYQADYTEAKSNLDKSQASLKTTRDDLDRQENHVLLLMVQNETSLARLYLTAYKDGAQAQLALKRAKESLSNMMPYLEKKKPELADSLEKRLDLVMNELVSDPKTALSDLEFLNTKIVDTEKNVFSIPN